MLLQKAITYVFAIMILHFILFIYFINSRYEHCIGVSHLAGKMLETLQIANPEEKITAKGMYYTKTTP